MPDRHHSVSHADSELQEGLLSVTGSPGQDHVEPQALRALDPQHLETLSDDDLEAELTIAAYAPGRVRWERYQRLLHERLRRRFVAA
jgi:hypothetical protein